MPESLASGATLVICTRAKLTKYQGYSLGAEAMEETVRHHIGNHTPTIKTVEFNHTRSSAKALKCHLKSHCNLALQVMALVLTVGGFGLGVNGIIQVVDDYKQGRSLGFRNLCDA